MTRAAFLLALIIAAGCRSSAGVAPQVVSSAPPTSQTQRDPESIRWVRESAEYRAALLQVYREATARVESVAASRASSTWAVVVDADETLISNAVYQAERARQGLAFTAESWNVWVKRREATALPGAAAFLARVRVLGG